ncbi:F-box/FBD/LRR-repeat protein At1g13570-like [Daucus carota subsp. sativus]|uniref:F-box/FBD/LRR-repeat protein At1g13570-like n=1 Tax=Daucus carota subsp. sativus TaxID=79200 RepID=UPI0007F02A9E|nr:PREDICTED: F-box/FBD/LRR-repeat protein At1g13570-like [Daucus carota subsp. sativus]
MDCPVLQKLTLLHCEGILPINFIAANLKCLHQRCLEMTSEDSLVGFKNLTEFSYWLSSEPEMQTEIPNVVKVFTNLCKIEKVYIAYHFIKYLAAGGSPNRLPYPLAYLKTLSISYMCFSRLSDASCLLCLIRSAPNLCKLNILAMVVGEKEDFNDCWDEDYEECTVDHLEIVTFSNFKGHKAELEFVKFLLAHSPSPRCLKHLKDPFNAFDYGPWAEYYV